MRQVVTILLFLSLMLVARGALPPLSPQKRNDQASDIVVATVMKPASVCPSTMTPGNVKPELFRSATLPEMPAVALVSATFVVMVWPLPKLTTGDAAMLAT